MTRKPEWTPGVGKGTCAVLMYATLATIVAGDKRPLFQPTNSFALAREHCPTNCDVLFEKLVDNPDKGNGRIQRVNIDERGEPKSGTGAMYEWATGALGHSCIYLQQAYGTKSCRIEWEFSNRTLIFEPSLALDGQEPPPCRCDGVDRVTISISNIHKHYVPVEEGCAYEHRGIGASGGQRVCVRSGGGGVQDVNTPDELWDCMVEASCKPIDASLQLAIMRDPRAVVVSSYFHLARTSGDKFLSKNPSVDEFALLVLPHKVRWVCLRIFLFTRIQADRAIILWYEDAMDDPLDWHGRFLSFVGLNMPPDLVKNATRVSVEGGNILGFPAKGLDEHPGGKDVSPSRTFKEEISPDTLRQMDAMMRPWFSPSILAKLGIPTKESV